MGRRRCWLETSHFNPEVGKGGLTLTDELGIGRRGVGENFTWNGESLAVNQISWRCSQIWFEGGSNGQQHHRQFPEPVIWLFRSQSNK